MRSRAALLPFPGDPFLLHYWMEYFNEFWADEIDTLYIYFNSPIEPQVVDYIIEFCMENPKINIEYYPQQIEHGEAINRMLDRVTEEYIMLIEDDGFIFKHGQVDKCFSYLESGEYEIVGSKRGSCATEILTRSQELYGLSYEGEGDQGCNFWPNFFFCKKELLLKTDRNFGARAWNRGEELVPLSRENDKYYAQAEVVTSDTFVNTSMQLLNLVPQDKIKYVPQYHGSPDDLDHFQRNYNLFNGQAAWCHIGSLSSGVGGIIQDGYGRSLSRRLIDDVKENPVLPNYCNTEQEKREWERRVQWWLTFWENREHGKIDEFAALYAEGLRQIIAQYGLHYQLIQRRQNVYKQIGL